MVAARPAPRDASWQSGVLARKWSTPALPEVLGDTKQTLRAVTRENLFVSLCRASAESLVSENTSRLSAMQRAENNIDTLLDSLNGNFHRLHQSDIDERLFDVTADFEALSPDRD